MCCCCGYTIVLNRDLQTVNMLVATYYLLIVVVPSRNLGTLDRGEAKSAHTQHHFFISAKKYLLEMCVRTEIGIHVVACMQKGERNKYKEIVQGNVKGRIPLCNSGSLTLFSKQIGGAYM